MAKISSNEIDHLSQLGRIDVEGEKNQQIINQLGEILDYVDELENAPIDLSDSDPKIELKNITRSDEIKPSLPVEKVLQNSPQRERNFIKVKKVFE